MPFLSEAALPLCVLYRIRLLYSRTAISSGRSLFSESFSSRPSREELEFWLSGFTVIPISLAVAAFRKGPQETAYFKVELLRHGLPTGTLEGEMRLTRERSFAKRRIEFSNKLVKKTIAARNSFKNVILLKEHGC